MLGLSWLAQQLSTSCSPELQLNRQAFTKIPNFQKWSVSTARVVDFVNFIHTEDYDAVGKYDIGASYFFS